MLTWTVRAIQLIDGKTDIEKFHNAFINLALPLFAFSNPIAAQKMKVSAAQPWAAEEAICSSLASEQYRDTEFTLWDRYVPLA